MSATEDRLSATRFYTLPPLEGKIATHTFTPFPAPVVYKISGPMGEAILYTTGAEAESFAVNFSKTSVSPLYKNQSPSLRLTVATFGVLSSVLGSL